MSVNNPDPSEEETIETAAATWICEKEDGLTPERARVLEAWRQADPRHSLALARMEKSLGLLNEMPDVRRPLEAEFGVEWRRPRRARLFPTAVWIGGIAALFLVGFLLKNAVPHKEDVKYYAAEPSVPRHVELVDGSIININAGSRVGVEFTPTERRITLSRGEAHFEVAHNANRPFIVMAQGVAVRAVGTAFNVKLSPTLIEVLVVEGQVELRRPSDEASARPRVGAGEQALVNAEEKIFTARIAPAAADSIRSTLAWHGRVMTLSDVALKEIVADFNRRNGIQIIIADPELGARKLGGSFALDELTTFVRMLEQDGEITAERREGEIVLRHAR